MSRDINWNSLIIISSREDFLLLHKSERKIIMAKSFFNIIDDETIEVNHNGEDVTFDLPFFYTGDNKPNLENEEELLAWAREHNILHGLLHKGIQKDIIDIRAEARPADKDGKKVSLIDDSLNAQERIFDHKIKPMKRPGQTATKTITAEDAMKVLKAQGMTLEQIQAFFNNN